MPTNKSKPNRLIEEKSPYLLQHAYNPVNWYPWGKDAFEKAKQENKPVFVSIGYSTCHWCHVMERESFEDQEVAELLNKHFISIKVDREERPDIDSIYMNVCQMLTGQGGWPLHVFLTAEQKPFHAGTYFPKESEYGQQGMLDLLPQIYNIYKNEQSQIVEIGEQLTFALNESPQSKESSIPPNTIDQAYQHLTGNFDTQYGGFGTAPKFPSPTQLLFLLRYYYVNKDENALNMVEVTLDGIARGGIYDHIGYGFARYSTDELWLVPHFEKMLYDQALLLLAYTETYQITEVPQYKEIVYNTVEFIEREMTHPDGGFYSAIDADSEGTEGTYYIWSLTEVLEILGEEEGTLFAKAYDITEEGNFEGKNIPNLIYVDAKSLVEEYDISLDELEDRLEVSRKLLLKKRQTRVYPHLDDKILTSWNGLLIAALAKAGATFAEPRFIDLADKGLQFIDQHLIKENVLFARYRDGEAKHNAYLDDYSNFIWALIEFHQATGDEEYIVKAKKLATTLYSHFEDKENGAFYFTNKEAEKLLIREKSALDNATPSGNGTAAMQLWRLGKITEDMELLNKVERIFSAFTDDATQYPSAVLSTLNAQLAYMGKAREIKINGDPAVEILNYIQKTYRPYDVWTHKKEDTSLSVQICQNNVCHSPLTDLEQIMLELS
ncbi:thioredoxin domain-containing protein [Psychrobacillus sp. FJAT-51614]|uniref:Thioredoxin domain-containing protein n=1 Tax=Psychrobacillus mangrovi TaxID=3117745 RepID=A0ABU8F3H0_9BACI